MCIIVAIPAGKKVSKDSIKRCWDNNPDGGGFMYNSSGKVVVHKEMDSFKRYWKAYSAAKENFSNSSFVLHFRISTHGVVNETNCHPFLVNQSLGFVHNGIISAAPRSEKYSDTYMFNNVILKKLPKNFMDSPVHVALIQAYIGMGSKLSFLNSKGQIKFVNEKAGIWDDGIWYSNGGYKAHNYFDYGGTKVDTKYNSVNASPYAAYPPKQTTIWETETNMDGSDDAFGYDMSVGSYGLRNQPQECEYCGDAIQSSGERINGVCNSCFNAILAEDSKAKNQYGINPIPKSNIGVNSYKVNKWLV